MDQGAAIAARYARTITVLCIDPCHEDHIPLQAIFNNSPWGLCPDFLWKLQTSANLESAWALLRRHRFPVVLCECDLKPDTWRELLERLLLLPEPPFLIVTSRLADERLWAEALNLGAYDVLAKPFEPTEVMRVVSMAWMHWTEKHDTAQSAALAAAGG